MSGIQMSEEAIKAYDELRLKHNANAIIFVINPEQTAVIVEQIFAGEQPAEEVIKAVVDVLPEKDCRFIVYDFKFESDGCNMSKLAFIQWSPEAAKTRPKMLYSSTKRACIDKMSGIQLEIQANSLDEFNKDYMLEKCRRK
ncbi:Cofilin/tropomyosin-type_actin-binding protein [Hexamita inflata]|uniref:Cofilin/tropomyosin-type actin-binding protein n=1 Tax=Hexamita inflata TaxID=28002 RepID=A0AA86TY13_9EUKA|nr:Cofilin/tropomyosin-type actin-binding protein [Hexamita inflata]CAI9931287.1 Cofilin/tropomyosin-type actin-binding protein [Hexamita inflata]CAI9976099.1 Cofilin/tropomyosin-type actin-binding protein [Hexamita inflata]